MLGLCSALLHSPQEVQDVDETAAEILADEETRRLLQSGRQVRKLRISQIQGHAFTL